MPRACAAAALLLAGLLSAGCASRGPVLAPPVGALGAPAKVELETVPFFPQAKYQCGPAALATVLAASGVATDADALVAQVYLPGREGSLQPELLAAARRQGRVALVIPPSPEALVAELVAGRPVLVLQNLGLASLPRWHYAVVVGFDAARDAVVLRSGRERWKVMGAAAFVRTWTASGQWGVVVLKPGELPAADDAEAYFRAVFALEQTAKGANGVDVPRAYLAGVQQWPAHRLMRIAAANASMAAGRVREAAGILAPLVAANPRDAVAVNNLASAWLAAGEARLAREVLEALPESAGAEPSVREALRRTRSEVEAALPR